MSGGRIALLAIFSSVLASYSLKGEAILNIEDFDSACGQPQHNCRSAFQKAFEAAAKSGGATLQLPAGSFPIDFPEVSNDVQSGRHFETASLISVPPRVMIQGHVDARGDPDTTIEWKVTSIPVFVFAGASYSGMRNLRLRFTGLTPTRFPYGDIALLRALRFGPTYPHPNQMSGGNYEMFSFAMLFDSEHCVFENLVFDSATHDNQHVFGLAINAKGKGVSVDGGGGGLTGLANGNRFSGIKLYDYVVGLLVAGQDDVQIRNVTADRRGSTESIPPGHVIYFTSTKLVSPDGKATVIVSRNVRVTNISEGPHTYSNINSLGTLAIKYIDGGIFEHVVSQHPVGLIQVLTAVKNLTFNDLNWSSDSSDCDGPAGYCGVAVIEFLFSKPEELQLENLRFTSIVLKSTRRSIITNFFGKTIDVDGITIETPPFFTRTPNQVAPYSALSIKAASDVTVRNFIYVPLLNSLDPGARYNRPFVCWGSCTNVKADVTIKWPRSIALPAPGNPAITSVIQFDKPDANNSIVSRIEIN